MVNYFGACAHARHKIVMEYLFSRNIIYHQKIQNQESKNQFVNPD